MFTKFVIGALVSGVIVLSPLEIVYQNVVSFIPKSKPQLNIKYEGNSVNQNVKYFANSANQSFN